MAEQDDIWLKRARDAYQGSTNYFDANIRSQIDANLRQVQGKHPAGSKYYAEAYKGRSRLFRPKTRAMMRRNEAICAAAFFASQDVVNISAPDENNAMQRASADLNRELVQYRLTSSIPWFMTVVGAYQDSMTSGIVISHQYWKYDSKKGIDQPCIELIPVENFRFDPNADWTNPVNTSPYLVQMIPMYVKDVKARTRTIDEKTGQPKWRPLTDAQILSATRNLNDSTRQVREGNRTDPTSNVSTLSEYQVVWVHRNFIEVDGEDYLYYTLGDQYLLSNPEPMRRHYRHGRRPFVIGYAVLETHKNYPAAPVELVKDIQAEINEVANQRIDNVKFAMNKRYFAKRNAQVDIRSLTRNVPSSVTLMNDIGDVKVLETNDVTGSSYQEHDRLNLDFDDVSGAFSGSSVQANRKLNETVGGMTLLSQGANDISEYQLRTFVETWAEPVIRQLVLLEQEYETDATILMLAGTRAELVEKYQITDITDELIGQELIVNINVGLGATNPQQQFERFVTGMKALAEIMDSSLSGRLDVEEVSKEIFGKMGYKDGKRFFIDSEDPRIAVLEQQLQELKAALDAKHPPEVIRAQVEKLQAESGFIRANTTEKNVGSQYAAMQAGQVVATTPGVAPVADEILAGAGFVPADGDGVNVPVPQVRATLPVHENTSPMYPPVPQSPMRGIETPEADGVQNLNLGGAVAGYSQTTDADNVPIMATANEGVLNVEAMQLLGEDNLNYLNQLGLQMREAQHLSDGGIVDGIRERIKSLFAPVGDKASEVAEDVRETAQDKLTTPPFKALNNALSGKKPEDDKDEDEQ